MSNQLPPSKFGAGTTYGQSGQPHALSQPVPTPPPPVAPPAYPSTQVPQTPTAYPTPTYQTPAPDPYAATQFSAPASYSHQAQAPAGGASAITAAILSLIGALWYGIDVVRGWDGIVELLKSLDALSSLGLSGSLTAWAYGSIASVVAQLIFVPVLLIGGILLLTRSSAGRTMVILGSLLVIATNIFWALAAFEAIGWVNNFTEGIGAGRNVGGELAARVLLNIGVPALLAVVIVVFAMTASAKLWCRRLGGQSIPPVTY